MKQLLVLPLTGKYEIKIKYAKENVSPETYYDHLHDHPFLEICIIMSGKMLHFAGGRTYRLRFGDIFFCRCGELHYALAAEPSIYERLAIWIPQDAFSLLEGGNEAAFGVFSDSMYANTNVLRLREGCEDKLTDLFEQLKKCTAPDSGIHGLCTLGKVAELLVFINENVGSPDAITRRDSDEMPRIIFDVIRFVRANYRTLNGINEVAEHFYINKDYLTRVFRQHTGFTVHDYLRSVRISKSKIMLKKGTGVTETAFSCGFNSTSYFIRVFKKATGITPAKYRESGKDVIENKE